MHTNNRPAEEAQLRKAYETDLTAPRFDDSGRNRGVPRSVRALAQGLSQWRSAHLKAGADPWVWSDQHLGHANIIKYCNRPFKSVEQMDRTFYGHWNESVGADDTVVFVGDLAMRPALNEETYARIRALPGAEKILVVGNHDVSSTGELLAGGFDSYCAMLFADTDPSLVFTHLPLREIPAGWVNIHGHTHNNEPMAETRHINVSVEQLEYRPVRLADPRRLAVALAGGDYPPGASTLERIRSL